MAAKTTNSEISNPSDSRIATLYEFLSKRSVFGGLTFIPVSLLTIFMYVIPVGWAIVAAFHNVSAFSSEWTWVGVQNFVRLMGDSEFHNSLSRSVVFAVGSVFLQLVVGVAIAFLINREFKFQYVTRSIMMLPYLVPTVVLGFITLWMGNSQFGIINQILVDLGVVQSYIPWFGDPALAMPAVIVVNSWKFSIFVTIMVLARLQSIPEGHYEAAKMCGANKIQMFRDVTLPNIKNVIFIVLLLRGVWMFNKFDLIYVMTRGGPLDATTTAPIFAYETAFQRANLGEAAAISVLLFVLLFATAIVYFRVFEPSSEVDVQ